VLSSGAFIGMPPAFGCPVTYLNDMGGSSRAALAVRLGAEGIEALSRPVTTRTALVVALADPALMPHADAGVVGGPYPGGTGPRRQRPRMPQTGRDYLSSIEIGQRGRRDDDHGSRICSTRSTDTPIRRAREIQSVMDSTASRRSN
jgi:hypothetical protein